MAPPAGGLHKPQPWESDAPKLPDPQIAFGASASIDAAGGNKQSFSAAELDHVPRYIAPDDDRPAAAAAPTPPRPVSAKWQPNGLASFSGGEWVPPAVAYEKVAAYVPPTAVSAEAKGSPRNLITAVAAVALVAGLGFGVSRALAPDVANVATPSVQPTAVVTTASATTSAPAIRAAASPAPAAPTSPVLTTRPMQISPAPPGADPFAPATDNELTTPPPAVRIAERKVIVITGRIMALDGNYGVVVADGRLPVPGDAQTVALGVDLDPASLRKAANILLDGTIIHHVAGTTTIDRLEKANAFASGIQQAAMEKFSSDGGFVVDVWYTDESFVGVTFRSPKYPDWELSIAYPGSLHPADPTAGLIDGPPLSQPAAPSEPATTAPAP